MKKIFIVLAAILTLSVSAYAIKMSDLKIYINPGHGGYSGDDRPMCVKPFAPGDTAGFWESSSNLYTGLHMYHILDSIGTKAYLSRIKNTEDDDRSLHGIGIEATNLGVDMFFSIHTNAGEDENYPISLYRENSRGVPRFQESVAMSEILWDNIHSNKLSNWTRDVPYVSGDLTFYPQWGSSGLGVLRKLFVPGLLSEGGMHEHRPECHRLLNDDYKWLRAWHFVRSIMEYFQTEDRFVTGNVAGIVYDDNNSREESLALNFSAYGIDRKKPLNGTYVELRDMCGNVIQKKYTDNMFNGVFVFRNIKPGNYKVVSTIDGYYDMEKNVTVVANEVTYQNLPMHLRRETPLEILVYTPHPAEGELVNPVDPIEFRFNHDISTEAFEKAFKLTPAVKGDFSYSESFHVARFTPAVSFEKNTTYTVQLTTELCTPDPYYSQSHLAKEFSYAFTTKDRNRLAIVQSFPVEGGDVHFVKPQLEFRFDQKLNTSGITSLFKVYDESGVEVKLNTRGCSYNKLNGEYGNAILQLGVNLVPGKKYKVVLNKDLKDVDGVPLNEEVVVNFNAVDQAKKTEGEVFEQFEAETVLKYNAGKSTGMVEPCKFYKVTGVKLFDAAALKTVYKFANKKDGALVLDYTGDMHIVKRGNKVGLYVNGDLNDHELQIGFTSGSDTRYFTVCKMDFVGWKYFEITLDTLEENYDYIFTNVRLRQAEGVHMQNGGFYLDNLVSLASSGVDSVIADDIVSVYVDDADMLHIMTAEEIQEVSIYDIQGRIVNRKASAEVNCSNLLSGVYFVKVVTAESECVKTVIVK